MPLTVWSILGGIVAIFAEYLYRRLPGPWHHYIYLWIPIQLFIGYVVCKIVQSPGTSLIAAFITWSVATLACRVLLTVFILHDKVTPGTWAGLGLLVCARIIQQVWK